MGLKAQTTFLILLPNAPFLPPSPPPSPPSAPTSLSTQLCEKITTFFAATARGLLHGAGFTKCGMPVLLLGGCRG